MRKFFPILMTASVGATMAGVILVSRAERAATPAPARAVVKQGFKPESANDGPVTSLPANRDVARREREEMRPASDALTRAERRLSAGDVAGAEQAAQEAMALAKGRGFAMLPGSANRILARVAMERGRYQEALERFGADDGSSAELGPGVELDVALCYVRIGNLEKAKRLYSDQMVLRFSSAKPEDLPGTRTPQTLEASILLARGLDYFLSGRKREAFNALEAAGRLVPRNGYIAYLAAMSLVHQEGRAAEALPYYRRAMRYGRGEFADEAWRHVPDAPRYTVKDGYYEYNFRTPEQAERKRAEIRARQTRARP